MARALEDRCSRHSCGSSSSFSQLRATSMRLTGVVLQHTDLNSTELLTVCQWEHERHCQESWRQCLCPRAVTRLWPQHLGGRGRWHRQLQGQQPGSPSEFQPSWGYRTGPYLKNQTKKEAWWNMLVIPVWAGVRRIRNSRLTSSVYWFQEQLRLYEGLSPKTK